MESHPSSFVALGTAAVEVESDALLAFIIEIGRGARLGDALVLGGRAPFTAP